MATVLISNLPEIQADNIDQFDNLIINDGADTTFSTSRVSIGALKQALFTNDGSKTGANLFTGSVTVSGTGASVTAPKFIGDLEGDVTGNVTGNVTGQVSDLSNLTTNDLAEGTINLYYTDARFDAKLATSSIKDLADVADAMTPNAGEVLSWVGGEWTSVPNDHLELSELSVVTGAPTNQGALAYDDGTGVFAFNPADSYTKAQADAKFETQDALGTTLSAYALKNNTTLSGAATLDGSPIVNNNTLATYVTAQAYAPITDANLQGDAKFAGSPIINRNVLDVTLNDYATAAQGAKADTALQDADIGVEVQAYDADTVVDADYATVKDNATTALQDASAFATAAVGTANDNAIDNLISGLNAIGNNAAITDVGQLKTALAALVRNNT